MHDPTHVSVEYYAHKLYVVTKVICQRKLQRATRAVHNRAAACVVADGGILENQI